MNILISTTTNHNHGDDFIRMGVKNILKYLFPEANYIHFDRNPNNMVDYPSDQRIIMANINWNEIDLVVLAGSPEFLHHPLIPIYEGLYYNPNIPLIAMGVGYSEPQFVLPLSNEEVSILKRDNTVIIVRQQELAGRLADILSPKKIHIQPCPALFCFNDFPQKTKDTLNTDYAYINSDPYDVKRIIGQHKRIITDRLHGAIAGISSGAYVELNNNSFRVQSAIELFNEVLECSEPVDILIFKKRILSNYLKILKEFYETQYTSHQSQAS